MKDELLENPLPSNDEAEAICLGAVLLDNAVVEQCVKYFGPDDLYSPFNRKVYQAMIELHQANQVIDPITIVEQLKTRYERADQYIRATEIVNLTFGLPHFSNIEEYAKIIKTHSLSRQAIRLANNVTRDLLAGDVDPIEVISKLEQKAIQLSNSLDLERVNDPIGFVEVRDLSDSILSQFERYHRGESTGVKTGMAEVDHILDGGGLQKKATYVIGGREKSGKTSLALDWCENITLQQGKASLIVTLEMSKEGVYKRLYSKHTGIPYYMFRPGFYDTNLDNPYTRAIQGLAEFSKYPFKIADNLFSMEDIYRHCAKQIELGHKENNHEVGVIVLDYLQLIGLADTRVSTVERVTNVSRMIKRLASDLDVAIIVMSNLNRTRLSEEGQEPDADNLRDSGSIAFDAEAVFFVHNPSYVPGKPYTQKEITDYVLILSRQRNGPTGRFNMKLIGPYMQFVTESDYNKTRGPDITVMPMTKGQQILKERHEEDLWDSDEDTESWYRKNDSNGIGNDKKDNTDNGANESGNEQRTDDDWW